LNAILQGGRWMHLGAAAASAALACLSVQIFCGCKAKDYDEWYLQRIHMPAHVEASVIAEAFLHRHEMPAKQSGYQERSSSSRP
jgi:hypothetical protein